MIDCEILPNGDLRLTCDDPDDLRDALGRHGFWSAFCDAMEPHSCNGSYTPFDAGDGDPFVGLSSAPCIAEGLSDEDDGSRVIDGRFWYFGDYMITCPLETLLEQGEVIFTLARDPEAETA